MTEGLVDGQDEELNAHVEEGAIGIKLMVVLGGLQGYLLSVTISFEVFQEVETELGNRLLTLAASIQVDVRYLWLKLPFVLFVFERGSSRKCLI